MQCFLGFDGGGTKTECVVLDASAKILARARSGPSNPFRIGVQAATRSLRDAAELALRQAAVTSAEVHAVCAGLAGTARPELAEKMRASLARMFPGAALQVLTDFELALAMLPLGPAIVLIAGTGSAAFGRDAGGRTQRAGGLGPAESDEGSAFDVGKEAVESVSRERNDSVSKESGLARQILRQLGCSHWQEVQERAAANADAVFPMVFPVVAGAADAGDEFARSLLSGAARKLASLTDGLAKSLGISSSPCVLGLSGGMIGRSSFFDAVLAAGLQELLSQASITVLSAPPAEAAARLALAHAQSGPGKTS